MIKKIILTLLCSMLCLPGMGLANAAGQSGTSSSISTTAQGTSITPATASASNGTTTSSGTTTQNGSSTSNGTATQNSTTAPSNTSTPISAPTQSSNPVNQNVPAQTVNQDTEPPIITEITPDKQTVNASEKVTFKAKVTDNVGVDSVEGYLNNPNGNLEQLVVFTYDSTSGEWTGTYTTGPNAYPGTWTLDLLAYDKAGNMDIKSATFTVNNTAVDIQVSPQLPQAVKPGDPIDFTVTITKNQSSIDTVQIQLTSPSGKQKRYADLTFDTSSGTWKGSYNVAVNDAPGDWTLEVLVSDTQGNSMVYPTNKVMTIDNPNADINPPVLENFTFSPDKVSIGGDLVLTAAAHDDQSGIDSIEVLMGSPSGTYELVPLTYDAQSQKWSGKYTFTSAGELGQWNLLQVFLMDNDGNWDWKQVTGSISVKGATSPPPPPPPVLVAKPAVNAVTDKDATVTGTAEAGSNIEVKANGSVIGRDTAGNDGKFTVTLSAVQKAGTVLSVTASSAGNTSEATVVMVKDATAPAKPAVDPVTDKDTKITGTAEAGSTVSVKANGKEISAGTAGSDGQFTVTIPSQAAGTQLSITATDKAGNTSEPVMVKVEKAMQSGWVVKDGKRYYYDPITLELQTGWFTVGGTKYYANAAGIVQTGWVKINTAWYYFDDNGAMQTGWKKAGKVWYYFNSNGAMQTGWLKSGNVWYYFNSNGAMQTGWLKFGKTWYYFKSSGAMQTGWLKLGKTWYYFNNSGAMVSGWVKISGKRYFFYSSGALK